MTRPAAKGWCPSAHRPMMSGDGLLVRIKPRFGRLSDSDLRIVADLSDSFGNSVINITSRANVQVRGVDEASYPKLLRRLQVAELVSINPMSDQLNLLIAPFTAPDSVGWRCAAQLYNAANSINTLLAERLAAMPAKFGFAIDCGPIRQLDGAFSDICIETDENGTLLIRCAGLSAGFETDEGRLLNDVCDVMGWYQQAQPQGEASKPLRMRDMVNISPPKPEWQAVKPRQQQEMLGVGKTAHGYVLAVAYGQVSSDVLRQIADENTQVSFGINRQIIVQTKPESAQQLIDQPDDPRLQIAVCPGQPHCASACIETRMLAEELVAQSLLPSRATVHISGCEKGCAAPSRRDICVVGRSGRFDIVEKGCTWDTPSARSLDKAGVMAHLAALRVK